MTTKAKAHKALVDAGWVRSEKRDLGNHREFYYTHSLSPGVSRRIRKIGKQWRIV